MTEDEKIHLMILDLEESFEKMDMEMPLEPSLIKSHHARLYGENCYD
jgi:hypothetical protein